MPRPWEHGFRLTGLFALERLDTWVFRVGLAVPLVCIAGLVLWHLLAILARKRPRRPRTVRLSPEPPSREAARRPISPPVDSPGPLQLACSELEQRLARKYIELAASWLHAGQPAKAVTALEKVLRLFPEGPQAELAGERLRQIQAADEPNHS